MAVAASKMGTPERLLATAGLMIATLMNSLDSTIANVALPHIQGALSASQDQITWVLTSYIVATALMTPLTGWLSLRIGRKRLFLLSVAGFVAVSILCGIATSLPEMVLFRLLQGIAGAAMMPISQAFVLDLWPQEIMPKVMAVWSAIIMVGPILGPTLGGLLTENYSWRWVFYINVPVGLGGFALVYLFLPRDDGGRRRPFDLLGFAALVLFTGAVQLVADRGPTLDWFDSREICIEAVVAVCAFYVFVMQSLTAEHPFFDRGLFVDRNYSSSMIFMFFVAGMLFSTTALLPSFMQNLLGYTALQSGLASMYRGFGSLAAFAAVTELQRRIGARATIVIGLFVASSAMWLMSHFDLTMTAKPIMVAGFVQGIGMGLMFGPLSVLGFATLPMAQRTEAAVFGNIVRSMAGSLGIATLQAVLIRQSAAAHEGLAARMSPSDPLISWALPSAFNGGGGLEALNAEVTRQGAMIGYDAIFAGMAVVSLLMLPLVLIMRPARPAPGQLAEAHAE
jgi:DHA2 family multidrug resistance protein